MAFRLQSALAGAATRLSSKFEKFDETYADSLKNTAANLKKEAKNIVKERTAAVRDYQKYGKRLIDDYGLNEGQVQAVLAGGLDRYDTLLEDVKSGAASHLRKNGNMKGWNPRNFVQNTLFSTSTRAPGSAPIEYMSLSDQAKMFGNITVPSTIDLDTEASAISAGTQRGIFKVDQEQVKAALGGVPTGAETYTGPGFADSGVTYNPVDLGAAEQLAFEGEVQKLSSAQTVQDLNETKIASIVAGMGVQERTTKLAEDANRRANELQPIQKQKLNQTILNLKDDITTNELTRKKLQEQFEILEETGMDAALLANDLVQAQIISEGTYSTAKEAVYAVVGLRDVAQRKLLDMKASDDFTSTEIDAQQYIVDGYQTMVESNLKLLGKEVDDELFSKVNLDNSFKQKLQVAASTQDVGLKFSGLNEAIAGMAANKMPQYLTAVNSVLKEMDISFGNFTLGENFIKGKKLIFEEGMDRYVQQTDFHTAEFDTDGKVNNREEAGEKAMDLGTMQLTRPSKTDDEATKRLFIEEKNRIAMTAKPGDILRVNTKSGAVRIYIMGSANKFIER
tara:strand:- start:3965 stop:5659 length:1695 start_codon:yes stop_codon:yes gene_type:complete